MKDYLNFEGLKHFLEQLLNKFSVIGHTHTASEIAGYREMIVTDDGKGNVVFECSSLSDNARIATLEEDIEAIKMTLEDNDILVADDY